MLLQTEALKKLEERDRELSDNKLLVQQHEVHSKTVAESMKQLDAKKSMLERQLDELNEECANLKARGERPATNCFSRLEKEHRSDIHFV